VRNFVAVGSWVSILWKVKIRHLPLTWPVAVNTVLALLCSLWQSHLTHLTCHVYDARRCVLIQQTNHSWHTWLSPLWCTKVCSHTTDKSQLTHLTCHVYDARRCVFIQQTITVDTPDCHLYDAQRCVLIQETITADTPDLSPLWCTKVCSHTTDKSQLTHLTCHVYDAQRCVLIQQTITADTPDLSRLRCTKVCFHTTDNHSWHPWLVTSTMHEGVFSYNRQSQLTPLTCHRYDARRCVLIQQTNHSWHTWLVTSTMHEGVFSYNRQITADTPDLSPLQCTKVCSHTTVKSQLTHLTCHVYDARRCVLIQQTNQSWHTCSDRRFDIQRLFDINGRRETRQLMLVASICIQRQLILVCCWLYTHTSAN